MGRIYMVTGPPGCGKTTNLCEKATEAVAKWGGSSVLICSLTRSAAAEVRRREIKIPAEQIGTMHAHCYRALSNPALAESKISQWNEDDRCGIYRFSGSGFKTGDSQSDGRNRKLSFGDNYYERYCLLRARMIPIEDKTWDKLTKEFAERWEAWKAENDYLDFADLIERTRLDCEYAPRRPQVIYLDEAQDSSLQELELAKHWSKDADLVMSGDLDQSIFTWRGADPQAFYDLKIPNDHRKLLGQSYRVPRAVHRTSGKWISQIKKRESIEYKPRDFDGETLKCSDNYRTAEKLLNFVSPYLKACKSVMFIGSCAFHLSPLIKVMRDRGIPFYNPYRLKDGRWNPLGCRKGTTAVDRIEAFLEPQTAIRWSLESLSRWIGVIKSDGFLVRGAKTQVKRWLKNKVTLDDDMLGSLFVGGSVAAGEAIEAAWDGNYKWLCDHLVDSRTKILDYPIRVADAHGVEALRKDPQIIVGTIHSVKGGEAGVVVVFPDLSRAGLEEWSSSGEGRDSIVRLFYVAMTRARETLILCAPGGPMRVEWGGIV